MSTKILYALLFLFGAQYHGMAQSAQPSVINRALPRIVGGVPANLKEFPFIASLQKNSRHFCGGALIAKNWVLTAAHCVAGSGTSKLKIKIGLLKQGDTNGVEAFSVNKIITHPEYNDSSSDYDFALLQLNGESRYNPIGLNADEIDIPDEEDKAPIATTAGWGAISEGGNLSSKLLKVDVPLVSDRRCEFAYPSQITKTMICAGFEKGGKDSCQGDSGGPLIIESGAGEKILIGVVSWGEGCARPKKYGVYSEVNSIHNWIKNQLGGTSQVVSENH